MKIGLVTSYFYPWFGGITEHVYYQYRELKKRGHEVRVITPFDGGDMLDREDDLIRIGRTVPFLVNGSAVKISLLSNGRVLADRILSEENFDIIHLHQPLFCTLGLTFLRTIRRRKRAGRQVPKVVGTFHACGGPAEKLVFDRLRFYYRQFHDSFDYRIAVSVPARDFMTPVLSGEYEIIPNGVDLDRYSPRGEKIWALDDGVFNILFVGRLEPRKGLPALLKSIPLLPAYTDKKFRLIVIGNGLLTNHYRRRIPREAADKIIFTGAVPFDDLPSFFRSAHLFCSPARYGESFGIVLIEAMAAGLPVVAGNNPGYQSVVRNGINGVVVNPRDPRDIARNIGTLMNSEPLRKRISLGGLAESRKYGWPGIID
jgi:phosphatidyl-myo-inositol alpha-mannosyltransferase